MKIALIGSRGIPASYGGFETFTQELSLHLKNKHPDLDLTVVCDRTTEFINNGTNDLSGVNLIYSKYSKGDNPLRYYYESIILSRNSDITIACGNAAGLFAPLNKLFTSKLIINSDGIEWKRTKWSIVKRLFVKLLEWMSIHFSDSIICDSKSMFSYINERYKIKNKSYIIEYGAYHNKYNGINDNQTNSVLKKYNITADNYHLIVCRLEPENNIDMIIKGYNNANRSKPLAIVGDILKTKFVDQLQKIAKENVLFLAGIYDQEELSIIRSKASTYIHGHSVGGTNPSLLEAMGSRNLCICHDNVFNRETTNNHGLFFCNELELTEIFEYIEDVNNLNDIEYFKNEASKLVAEYYNWDNISDKYFDMIGE